VTDDHGREMSFRMLSDREYEMTRVFDAPRELVFAAYTDPTQIPRWWGPRGVTTIVDTMDVRPGGTWRFIQRGADGAEYAFGGVYREVVPPQRLVYTLVFEFTFPGRPEHDVLETLTFEEESGKTLLRARWLFQSPQDRDGLLASGAEGGMAETWDRLAELLASLT
jgi:uncharacterized protein YndB with AHSA1/START domain